jgi:hypothetical protein
VLVALACFSGSRALWVLARERPSIELLDRELPNGQIVLYLRSFAADSSATGYIATKVATDGFLFRSREQSLLATFVPFGNVISIANPRSPVSAHGSRTFAASDKAWRESVSELIRRASLIVVSVDDSPGIKWEMEEIISSGASPRTIWLFESRLLDFDQSKVSRRRAQSVPGGIMNIIPVELAGELSSISGLFVDKTHTIYPLKLRLSDWRAYLISVACWSSRPINMALFRPALHTLCVSPGKFKPTPFEFLRMLFIWFAIANQLMRYPT